MLSVRKTRNREGKERKKTNQERRNKEEKTAVKSENE